MTHLQPANPQGLSPLLSFRVTVQLLEGSLTYTSLGPTSAVVHLAALDRFDLCGVSVRLA